MITGIDHIQLAMPKGQEAQAREFFTGALGMPEIEKPDSLKARGGVWFICGAQELHIGVEPGFRPAKKAHPALLVADLDGMTKTLGRAGIIMRQQPPLPGARRVFIDDPFGNRIELIERE